MGIKSTFFKKWSLFLCESIFHCMHIYVQKQRDTGDVWFYNKRLLKILRYLLSASAEILKNWTTVHIVYIAVLCSNMAEVFLHRQITLFPCLFHGFPEDTQIKGSYQTVGWPWISYSPTFSIYSWAGNYCW